LKSHILCHSVPPVESYNSFSTRDERNKLGVSVGIVEGINEIVKLGTFVGVSEEYTEGDDEGVELGILV